MPSFDQVRQYDFTIIGQGNHLKGEFTFQGVVKIAGHLEGKIKLAPKARLTIEKTGRLDGDIECEHIEIYGQFNGTIHGQGKVILWPASQVEGIIHSENLTIYPGADVTVEAHTN